MSYQFLKDLFIDLSNELGLTRGTDIFLGYFAPTAPDKAARIEEVTGPISESGLHQDVFRVITRDESYKGAKELAESIHNTFDRKRYKTVIGTSPNRRTVIGVQSTGNPFPIGEDDQGRHLFSADYVIVLDQNEGSGF